MDKNAVVHLYNGIRHGHKNEGILTFSSSMHEPENYNIMLSEISQLEKDRYHVISLMCGI